MLLTGAKKILSIPDRTQGLVFTSDYIILSQSYGRRNPSIIDIHKNPMEQPPNHYVQITEDDTVPLWFLDSNNLMQSITLPPMAEGITIANNQLVVLFESGAEPYRLFGTHLIVHFL